MQIVSDLRWLISEGYVIEFNDGTLDLPRAKTPPPAGGKPTGNQQAALLRSPRSPRRAVKPKRRRRW
jgi:hypothetical protein